MGSNLSTVDMERVPEKAIEFIYEVHVTIASGITGVFYHIYYGMNRENLKMLLIGSATVGALFYLLGSKETVSASPEKVVFITGCDSGLGYSLAVHAGEIGFTVLAGCLSRESEGAKKLKRCSKIVLIELDITKEKSILSAIEQVELFLSVNEPCELWALVNNAGVMVFGEFEWQTEKLVRHQIDVNLLGTMFVTQAFLPMLRRFEGRIVNITSHCSKATLPGLSVYGASKAALSAWNDGLRIELAKFGISVINFIPGSFVLHSNIMAKQSENFMEMQESMNVEQLTLYGDYFGRYSAYLNHLAGNKKVRKIRDDDLYRVYEQILLEKYPNALYVRESFKYKFYHFLFFISPWRMRDQFVNYFMQLPQWRQTRC